MLKEQELDALNKGFHAVAVSILYQAVLDADAITHEDFKHFGISEDIKHREAASSALHLEESSLWRWLDSDQFDRLCTYFDLDTSHLKAVFGRILNEEYDAGGMIKWVTKLLRHEATRAKRKKNDQIRNEQLKVEIAMGLKQKQKSIKRKRVSKGKVVVSGFRLKNKKRKWTYT